MMKMFIKIVICFSGVLSFFGCETAQEKQKSTESPVIFSDQVKHIIPAIPEEMRYCGIKIPLSNFDVRERLDKELIVNTHYHSSTIQILKRSTRYFPEIERIFAEENIPEDLKYICVIESAFNQATSPTGAKGFWQFMPETGREFGLEISKEVDERMDVIKSTYAACEYLKRAQHTFDNWILASASYNCGMSGLSSKMKAQKQNDFFDLYLNKETSRYVFRILAFKLIMENPSAAGFDLTDSDTYSPIPFREVVVENSIADLAVWAKDQGSNLRMIKVMNPWLISNTLTIKNKKYTIKIPQ